MRFVDEVRITVASGSGGNGCVSFLRERFRPRGGPDGGNGGRGGDLVISATRARNTLVDIKWNKVYQAGCGENGSSRDKTGAAGEPLTIYVPVGTVLSDHRTGEVVADLHTDGSEYVLEGGDGGRGNATYRTSTNRTPRMAQEGFPGQEMTLRMELKLLADIGLLGFPNAGKSTLISRISSAKPKIADYPFTTLVPNLGVVKVNEGESFVVADIPGLVEGASDGVGLGHQFLKHVERCRFFLHLVAPDEEEDLAVDRFKTIEEELARYDKRLLDRPRVTLLTKSDLLSDEERAAQAAALRVVSEGPVGVVSSVTGEGLRPLVYELWKLLQTMSEKDFIAPEPQDVADVSIHFPDEA